MSEKLRRTNARLEFTMLRRTINKVPGVYDGAKLFWFQATNMAGTSAIRLRVRM